METKSWALKNIESLCEGSKNLKRDSLTLRKVPLEVPGIANSSFCKLCSIPKSTRHDVNHQ